MYRRSRFATGPLAEPAAAPGVDGPLGQAAFRLRFPHTEVVGATEQGSSRRRGADDPITTSFTGDDLDDVSLRGDSHSREPVIDAARQAATGQRAAAHAIESRAAEAGALESRASEPGAREPGARELRVSEPRVSEPRVSEATAPDSEVVDSAASGDTAAYAPDSADAPGSAAPRIISLDVARGLMLVVSVAVNAWITAPAWFEHAPWQGVHPVDLVFPTFVALSGAGLAFAYSRRVPLRPMVHRVVVLTLAGFAYTAHAQYLATGGLDLGTFRVLGVLQFYAALVLLVALAHLLVRRWWAWPVFTIVLAVAYAYALSWFAAGCPTGALTPQCNPSGVVDPAVFGAEHIYRQGRFGHDPEGLVALVGALVVASAGASIGHLVKSSRLPTARLLAVGALTLAAFAGVAAATAPLAPPMKRLWTPAFGLGVATACGAVLLLLYLVLDRPGRQPRGQVASVVTYPLIGLGRNSLLVYFGSHVLMTTLVLLPHGAKRPDSLAGRLAATAPGGIDEALWLVLLAVAAWTALAALLHHHGLYLRPSGGRRPRAARSDSESQPLTSL